MSEVKKTFIDWEEKLGVMVRDADEKTLKSKITEAEFRESWGAGIPSGVNHKQRIKFLKDNGYEVTRENMLDGQLSVVQPDPES